MKAEELMVGDWVFVNNIPKQVVGLNIIGGNTVYLLGAFSSVMEVYSDSEVASAFALPLSIIEPIPLTKEILELNGFENSHNISYYKELVVKNTKFSITCTIDSVEIECIGYTRIRLFIDYVHELQHALRLCGLVDMANNFKVE